MSAAPAVAISVTYNVGVRNERPERTGFAHLVEGNVLIYHGDGKGKFRQEGSYKVGDYPAKAILGDFNGDGRIDIATANTFSNDVSILLNNGDGTFTYQGSFAANQNPHMIDVGDFHGTR